MGRKRSKRRDRRRSGSREPSALDAQPPPPRDTGPEGPAREASDLAAPPGVPVEAEHVEQPRPVADGSPVAGETPAAAAPGSPEVAPRGEMPAAAQPRDAAIAELERRLRDAEAHARDLFERLSTREWRRGVWETLWHERDAEADAARGALARASEERAALDAQLAALKAEFADREQRLTTLPAMLEREVAVLREQIVRAADERAAVNGQLAALKAELAERERRLATLPGTLERDIAELREQLAREQRARAELEASRAQAEGAARRAGARAQELEATCAAAAEALQAQYADVQRLTARLAEEEQRSASLSRQTQRLEQELESARRTVTAASAAAYEASTAFGLETERRVAAERAQTEQCAALEAEIAALRERLRGAEEEGAPSVDTTQTMPAIATGLAAGAPRPRLERIGEGAPALVELSGRMVVGRSETNDVSLADRSVSRCHGLILVHPDRVVIQDLRSANGTSVNGTRIRRAELHDGDLVAFGRVQFRFWSGAATTLDDQPSPDRLSAA